MSLVAELQRRRVFRALVGYGIAAFAILQIIEPIMHGLHWPEAVLSYVVVALAVGFPAVVALAWIFDVNAGRIERIVPVQQTGRPAGLPRTTIAVLLVGIGLLAAAPGLVYYFLLRKSTPPAAQAARAPSIAVLPFVNLSSDKENEYFSDGMTEEIINALANVEGVRVVARTSAFFFKGKNVNVREIGKELDVATVLEGSVRREGNQLRVTAQLVNVVDGYHLWSKTYDRELKNVFSLEDELARAIVQALAPRLVPAAPLVPQATVSEEAHDLYLKGRFFWNQRTPAGVAKAAEMFEQALVLDPRYALAHSGLSDSYILFSQSRLALAAEAMPKARIHALQAVSLDEGLAEAHTSLAMVAEEQFEWTTAESEFKRALQLSPGYATAHQWYALCLMNQGRLTEAQAEIERALRLDPTSRIINLGVGLILDARREYDRAIEQSLKTLELAPGWLPAQNLLVRAYLSSQKLAEARSALSKAASPQDPLLSLRIMLLAADGDLLAAKRQLPDLDRIADPHVFNPKANVAEAHLAVGDRDGAFRWLEKGVEEREAVALAAKVNPRLDPIRSDPRYHELLKRMQLE